MSLYSFLGPSRIPRSKFYVATKDPATDEYIFTCVTCGQTTPSKEKMVLHKQQHRRNKYKTTQPCRYCNQEIKVYSLAYHLEEQHGIPAPTCEICGKKFPLPSRLEEHKNNVHKNKKPFVCSICDTGFFHKHRLTRHMVAHTGEKKYKCHICDKTFAWDANLSVHMKTHKTTLKGKMSLCKT